MLIRSRYHWIIPYLVTMYFILALTIAELKSDHLIVPLYLALATALSIFWSSSYTTLSEGVLTKQILFITWRSFPVSEITSIIPHNKHNKWSYGTVVNIFHNSGKKITLQPNKPGPFLAMLREQAPQADYLL